MNRSNEPLFDPRVADWLEEAPNTAPDQALDVILAAFPSIKQRSAPRGPWRFVMPTYAKALAAAAAVVVVVLSSAWLLGTRPDPSVGGPGPIVSPSPSPAPSGSPSGAASPSSPGSTVSFTSPIYGYTVSHPAPYQPTPATEAWVDGIVGNAAPWVDRFFSPTSFVGIASQPLDGAETPSAWMDAYATLAATRQPCDVPDDTWSDATIQGVDGRRAEFDCEGTAAVEIVWVADGQGWVITGERAVVDLMVETFTTD